MPARRIGPFAASIGAVPSNPTSSTQVSSSTSGKVKKYTRLSPKELPALAKTLRRQIITMIGGAGSGHPGGSLSAVDIIATLYFNIMRHDPTNPAWADRDRFVLSKGHAAPALYAVLAEAGYFPTDDLCTLRKCGSYLQGHTDMTSTPGVEMSAGALGQGLSFSVGIALAGRLDSKDYRVYVLLGDGECQEGQVWEAAMAAAHFKVDNLTAIVDRNQMQIDGMTKDIMSLEPFATKWRSFGWHVIEVEDGHNFDDLIVALNEAKQIKGRPTVVIAHTVKGKGVSFMEHNLDFHGKAPTPEQLEKALTELA